MEAKDRLINWGKAEVENEAGPRIWLLPEEDRIEVRET